MSLLQLQDRYSAFEFEVKVGVHQSSILSPLLFNVIMKYVTEVESVICGWHRFNRIDALTDTGRLNLLVHIVLESRELREIRTKTEYCKQSGQIGMTQPLYVSFTSI